MRKLLVLIAAAGAGFANAQHTIDDFSSGPYNVTIFSGSDFNTEAGTMDGGNRGNTLTVESNPLNQPLNLDIGSGGLSVINSGTLTDGKLLLEYGTYGSDLNDNLSGFDRFRINFLANDNPMKVTITVSTTGGGTSSMMKSVAGGQFSAFTEDFLFSGFAGGANFSDLDKISFLFDSSASGDFAVDSLQAVPEPATMAALAVGLSLIARRRRK